MELKNCPFCGAMVQIELDDSFFVRCLSEFAVNCHECNATGPLEDTKEAAMLSWNTRVRNDKE